MLRLAAALETGSSHPLAPAILARAKADKRTDAAGAAMRRRFGGKGVDGTVDGVALFLGSPSAAGERAARTPSRQRRIAALNDAGQNRLGAARRRRGRRR